MCNQCPSCCQKPSTVQWMLAAGIRGLVSGAVSSTIVLVDRHWHLLVQVRTLLGL